MRVCDVAASDTSIRNSIEALKKLANCPEMDDITLDALKAFKLPGTKQFEPVKALSLHDQPVSYQSAGAIAAMLFGTPHMRDELCLFSKIGVQNVSEHYEVSLRAACQQRLCNKQ